jgi:hypothetical protein
LEPALTVNAVYVKVVVACTTTVNNHDPRMLSMVNALLEGEPVIVTLPALVGVPLNSAVLDGLRNHVLLVRYVEVTLLKTTGFFNSTS